MAALALARPVGSRGTAPGLTNPEQYALAWMPHRHERRFSPRDESEEGDAVGFVQVLPDQVVLPAVARLGEDRDPAGVVRHWAPGHHDLRSRMRGIEIPDDQVMQVMQAPGGPFSRGKDQLAGPTRTPTGQHPPAPPTIRLVPFYDDFVPRIGGVGIPHDDCVLRLPRPHRGDGPALLAVAVPDLVG